MAARLVNPLPTLQILKIYTDALTRLNRAHQAGVLITTLLSQGRVLGAAPRNRKRKQNPHLKDREGNEEPLTAGPAHRSIEGNVFLTTFPQTPPFVTVS